MQNYAKDHKLISMTNNKMLSNIQNILYPPKNSKCTIKFESKPLCLNKDIKPKRMTHIQEVTAIHITDNVKLDLNGKKYKRCRYQKKSGNKFEKFMKREFL